MSFDCIDCTYLQFFFLFSTKFYYYSSNVRSSVMHLWLLASNFWKILIFVYPRCECIPRTLPSTSSEIFAIKRLRALTNSVVRWVLEVDAML